jgi:hypothetical protein
LADYTDFRQIVVGLYELADCVANIFYRHFGGSKPESINFYGHSK